MLIVIVIFLSSKISKTSSHRAVHRLIKAICQLKNSVIRMPQDLTRIKQRFKHKSGFNNVIGAIDCTQVKIQSPGRANGEIFRNRKGYFSINVQCIADTNLIFHDVVAKWPGSTHDSRIFNNSYINQQLMDGQIDGILLGDAGYALLPYLVTPFPQPVNERAKKSIKIFNYWIRLLMYILLRIQLHSFLYQNVH